MQPTRAPLVLALSLLLVFAVPVAAEDGPNEEQRGDNSLCLEYNVYQGSFFNPVTDNLWVVSDRAPFAAIVDVEPGTWFQASVSGPGTDVTENQGGEFHIHFWDEDGDSVKAYSGTHGYVPEEADHGTICVRIFGKEDSTDVPNPEAEWTYQDGFHDPYYGE